MGKRNLRIIDRIILDHGETGDTHHYMFSVVDANNADDAYAVPIKIEKGEKALAISIEVSIMQKVDGEIEEEIKNICTKWISAAIMQR